MIMGSEEKGSIDSLLKCIIITITYKDLSEI
jgi:hypothetical protein